MPTVTSADGTTIAYETTGTGPALILVDGALCYRGQGPSRDLALALADTFTVYRYDRRGRGESGDTAPWSADREIEDLAALLAVAGGTAYLFGCSSGAVLAADAANRLPGVTRLALYEPPFIVDDTHAPRPATFLAETEALLAAGDPGGAVKKFLRSVDMPGFAVRILALLPLGLDRGILEVEPDHALRRELLRPLVGEDRLAAADVEQRLRVGLPEQLLERALEARHQPPDDRVGGAVLVVGVAGDRALGVARHAGHSFTASRSSVCPRRPAWAPVVASRPLEGWPGS